MSPLETTKEAEEEVPVAKALQKEGILRSLFSATNPVSLLHRVLIGIIGFCVVVTLLLVVVLFRLDRMEPAPSLPQPIAKEVRAKVQIPDDPPRASKESGGAAVFQPEPWSSLGGPFGPARGGIRDEHTSIRVHAVPAPPPMIRRSERMQGPHFGGKSDDFVVLSPGPTAVVIDAPLEAAFEREQQKKKSAESHRLPSAAEILPGLRQVPKAVVSAPPVPASVVESPLPSTPQWTIQLIAFSGSKDVDAFLKRYGKRYKLRVYKAKQPGKALFIVSVGRFASFEVAQGFLKQLPLDLRKGRPMVRQEARIRESYDAK